MLEPHATCIGFHLSPGSTAPTCDNRPFRVVSLASKTSYTYNIGCKSREHSQQMVSAWPHQVTCIHSCEVAHGIQFDLLSLCKADQHSTDISRTRLAKVAQLVQSYCGWPIGTSLSRSNFKALCHSRPAVSSHGFVTRTVFFYRRHSFRVLVMLTC